MPRSANAVRIIGGRCRGRIVRFPASAALRPTPDRVRETLFNWLGQDLAGRRTLELYAGSGALSLESLSRGAAAATAVERDRGLAAAIAANAALLGLGERLAVVQSDVRDFLARDRGRYDVIYCDPPYAEDPWPWLLAACAERLAADGALYAEARHPIAPPPGLARHRDGRAGRVVYHLFRPA